MAEELFFRCTELTTVKLSDHLTQICSYAFALTNIVTLQLPETLAYIGENAFWGCEYLTAIELPDSIEIIESFAFEDCRSLASIMLGKGLRKIGTNPFLNCRSLSIIGLSADNINYVVSDGLLYSADYKRLISCADKQSTGCCAINTETELMDEGAFGFSQLSTVILPGSLSVIKENTFLCCRNLSTVQLSEGIESIEEGAFSMCDNLREITIPHSVSSIDPSAFSNHITLIVYNGTYGQQFSINQAMNYHVIDMP